MHVFVHKHPFASNPFDCKCLSNARVATIGGGGGEEGGDDNSGLIDDGFGAPRGDVATESAHKSASGIVATPEVRRRNGATCTVAQRTFGFAGWNSLRRSTIRSSGSVRAAELNSAQDDGGRSEAIGGKAAKMVL